MATAVRRVVVSVLGFATVVGTAAVPAKATPVTCGLAAHGPVLVPGISGLQPAPRVAVEADFHCGTLASQCVRSFDANDRGTSDDTGNFRLTWQYSGGVRCYDEEYLSILRANVDGVELRALFVASGQSEALIDPVSEAAVRIFEETGPGDYDVRATMEIVAAVRRANETTDFAGLGIEAAIARAMEIALADPRVAGTIRTRTPTPTYTWTPTPTVTPTATRRATATPRPCLGDCDRSGQVSVADLVRAVSLALGAAPAASCPAFDLHFDGLPRIEDLLQSVNNALDGCVLPSPLPDLVPELAHAEAGYCPYYGSACLEVCVGNYGNASAQPFAVRIGALTLDWPTLLAGDGLCMPACGVSFVTRIDVDPVDQVTEGREWNNAVEVRVETPTRCPSPTPT